MGCVCVCSAVMPRQGDVAPEACAVPGWQGGTLEDGGGGGVRKSRNGGMV